MTFDQAIRHRKAFSEEAYKEIKIGMELFHV